MTTETITHLDTRDAAAMLRRELKTAFPGVKFSVRIQRYAEGSSIRVIYTDGPALDRVNAIAKDYNGRGFDGMTDSTFYYPAFTRDGKKYATTCFCFVERELSEEALETELADIALEYGLSYTPSVREIRLGRAGDPQESLWWGRMVQQLRKEADL